MIRGEKQGRLEHPRDELNDKKVVDKELDWLLSRERLSKGREAVKFDCLPVCIVVVGIKKQIISRANERGRIRNPIRRR